MDSSVQSPNENIRKIEDIIDIQKANGNYSMRQVAFSLPTSSEAEGAAPAPAGCACAAGLARSLDSGLSKTKSDSRATNKPKPKRAKRHASPLPDVVSWPSDSDITVLRMKLCLPGAGAGGELKEAVGDAVPGDGLHRPDSSSMVNLATLMLQSQPPSKHSLGAEEYLLPLTSWERRDKPPPPPPEGRPAGTVLCGLHDHDATCDNLSSKDSGIFSRLSKKSKVAKFLRLYFCPCCTCLYEMEKMRDEPSVYLTKCNTAENVQI